MGTPSGSFERLHAGLTDADRTLIRNLMNGFRCIIVGKPHDRTAPTELIEQHAARVAAELSSPENESRFPECWACGVRAPKKSSNEALGWRIRPANIPGTAPTNKESYCPDCFAQWGWPTPSHQEDQANAHHHTQTE